LGPRRRACRAAGRGMGLFSRLLGGLGGSRGSLSSLGKAYKLVARTPVARNTHRFTFALESPEAVLGLPVGHHLEVRLPGGDGLSRAYTPVTGDRRKGSFDLVVKVYPGGRLGEYLDSLKVGDSAEVAGPQGELTYRGAGAFEIEDAFDGGKRAVQCSGLGMVAGGTGVTPMFQIAEHSAAAAEDRLQMSLLFANRTPEDVMLKEELDALAAACPRFRVAYSVDEVPAGAPSWPGSTGRVSAALLEEALGRLPARPELVCVCGPPGFHRAVKKLLTEDLGYDSDAVFEF